MGSKWLIEIFEEAEKADNPVQVLEQNRNTYMDQFIDMMKAGVDWDLPEGAPTFKTQKDIPLGEAPTSIYNVIRRFYIFDRRSQVNKLKRETIFIQTLEGLHYKEAQLVIDLKDGNIPYKYPRLWKAVGGKPVEPRTEAPKEEEPEMTLEPMEEPKKEKVKRAVYNNGVESKMFVPGQEPEGWVKGRLKK